MVLAEASRPSFPLKRRLEQHMTIAPGGRMDDARDVRIQLRRRRQVCEYIGFESDPCTGCHCDRQLHVADYSPLRGHHL